MWDRVFCRRQRRAAVSTQRCVKVFLTRTVYSYNYMYIHVLYMYNVHVCWAAFRGGWGDLCPSPQFAMCMVHGYTTPSTTFWKVSLCPLIECSPDTTCTYMYIHMLCIHVILYTYICMYIRIHTYMQVHTEKKKKKLSCVEILRRSPSIALAVL